jgi:hypothetical protein
LRNALTTLGYVNASPADPTLFDGDLDTAVRAYQRDKGLGASGVVDSVMWQLLSGESPAVATALPTDIDPTPAPAAVTPPAAGSSVPWLLIGAVGLAGAFYLRHRSRQGAGEVDGPGRPLRLAGVRRKRRFGADNEDDASTSEARPETPYERRRREYEERALKVLQRAVLPSRDVEGEVRAKVQDIRAAQADGELTPSQAAVEVARLQSLYARGGRGLPKGGSTYSTVRLTGGQRYVPGDKVTYTRVSTELKRMRAMTPDAGRVERKWTANEEEAWAEKDFERNVNAPQGQSTRVPASRALYIKNPTYRAEMQEEATRRAEAAKRKVTVVSERGAALFTAHPGGKQEKTVTGVTVRKGKKLGNLRDVTSERLIREVETAALRQNCPKAVRDLGKVRALVSDTATRDLYASAVETVRSRCSEELAEDAGERASIRHELPETGSPDRDTAAAARRAERDIALRQKKAKADRERKLRRGKASSTAVKEAAELTFLTTYGPPETRGAGRPRGRPTEKPTTRYVKKRRGELPEEVLTFPSGQTRRRRIRV